MGELSTIKLPLPADTTRAVRFYTSHPSLSYFPSGYDKSVTLAPGSTNYIPINIRSFSVKTQNILVHCVDVSTRELVYAWNIKVIGSEPQISKRYELVVRCGSDVTQKFIYENRSPSFGLFEFVSSHPDILQVSTIRNVVNSF